MVRSAIRLQARAVFAETLVVSTARASRAFCSRMFLRAPRTTFSACFCQPGFALAICHAASSNFCSFGSAGGGALVAAASSDISFETRTILPCAFTSSATSAHGAFAGIKVASGSRTNSLDVHCSAWRPVIRST